jgi:hypothetical protein
MNWVKIIFIIAGLYLVVTNLMDMLRDPSTQNIGVQAVSIAIGGGIIAYGMSYKPVTQVVTAVLDAVKGTAAAAAKTAANVAGQATGQQQSRS